MTTCEKRFDYSKRGEEPNLTSPSEGYVIASEVVYVGPAAAENSQMCKAAIAQMEPSPICPFPDNDQTNCPYLDEDQD